MFKRLKMMKISKRLNLGYAIVIAMMVLSGIFSVVSIVTLYGDLNTYVNVGQKADTAVKNIRINTNIAARTIREMALSEDSASYAEYRTKVDEKMQEVETSLQDLKESGVLPPAAFDSYVEAIKEWGTIGDDIMKHIEQGKQEDARNDIFDFCVPALNEMVDLAQNIDVYTDEIKADQLNSAKIAAMVGGISVVAFILIAGLLAFKIGKVIIRTITEPLSEVEKVANELTAGNLHSTIEYHSEDEIGNLAHSLRKSIRILGTYVDDISHAMKEFSNGNFDVEPEVEWKGDFEAILESFMMFEQSMADTIKGIHGVAEQVKNGAEQVAASSADLAQGATDQAAVTEELTATIVSVSDQVAQNAEEARKISKKVDMTGVDIVNSNGKMQEMVSSMSEINDSSREISKIIATINDIASQTNLLALNASIEAARAGEAGRGFAVVADQVSLLAAQSAEAAKESTLLIESSVRAVEKGMVVANETAQELQNVVESSKAITAEVNIIAEAMETQTESMNQINVGIGQINDVVQTNSATSEECAAASQEMSSQSEHLEELIRRFKIADHD